MPETLEEQSSNVAASLTSEKKFPDKTTRISFIVGIVGSILILIGNFMPVVNWRIREYSTFIQTFPLFGGLLILLVAISLLIMFLSKKYILVYVGVVALSVLAYTYHQYQSVRDNRIEQGDASYWSSIMSSAEASKYAAFIAKLNIPLIEKERHWVWTSLTIGSLLLTVSGVMSNNSLRKWFAKNFALFEQEKGQ